jgi:hypothetical protein
MELQLKDLAVGQVEIKIFPVVSWLATEFLKSHKLVVT